MRKKDYPLEARLMLGMFGLAKNTVGRTINTVEETAFGALDSVPGYPNKVKSYGQTLREIKAAKKRKQ